MLADHLEPVSADQVLLVEHRVVRAEKAETGALEWSEGTVSIEIRPKWIENAQQWRNTH